MTRIRNLKEEVIDRLVDVGYYAVVLGTYLAATISRSVVKQRRRFSG